MSSIEAELALLNEKLDNHMATSVDTNTAVTEVLSIIQAGKGWFRVTGWLFDAAKWLIGIGITFGSAWFFFKDHSK